MFLRNKKAEGSVSTAVKLIISVTIGALIMAGTYFVINDIVTPGMVRVFDQKNKILPEEEEENILNPRNIIPHNAVYIKNDIEYEEGFEFPALELGDKYIYQEYSYSFEEIDGQNVWNVVTTDKNKVIYREILESINNYPVTHMVGTFEECRAMNTSPAIPSGVINMKNTFNGSGLKVAPILPSNVQNLHGTFAGTNIKSAPVIPNSVTNMTGTFAFCNSLTSAPVIPNGVKNIQQVFDSCSSLTTAPIIPSSVTNLFSAFSDCTSLSGTIEINTDTTRYKQCLLRTKITSVTGSTTHKSEILATKND